MASSAPPTPTSLLGLPTAWLLQLATTFVMDEDGATVLALVRTCAFFRDALRKTTVAFSVPIDDDEEFWGVEDELCAVARRGGNIRLRVVAEAANVGAQITRLLRRAAARLGGERPLACIKSVHLRDFELTALVPAWVRELCPNVESLTAVDCGFLMPASAGANLQAPALVPCRRLRRLEWADGAALPGDDRPVLDMVRRELAALPSLTSLDAEWWDLTLLDQGGALSTSLARLQVESFHSPGFARSLATMFPALRELRLVFKPNDDVLYIEPLDGLLDGLLQHLGHVDLTFPEQLSLWTSFTHRAWPWPHLKGMCELDVGALARLPLHSIASCTVSRGHEYDRAALVVHASADAQAVARVAEAFRRWGGVQRVEGLCGGVVEIKGHDFESILRTLGPVLAALPAEQCRHVRVWLEDLYSDEDLETTLTRKIVRRLSRLLPACVERLTLHVNGAERGAWRALLPSLPATVERVDCTYDDVIFGEQALVGMCAAATRRVTVGVWTRGPKPQLMARVRARLAEELSGGGAGGEGGQQGEEEPLVTVVNEWFCE